VTPLLLLTLKIEAGSLSINDTADPSLLVSVHGEMEWALTVDSTGAWRNGTAIDGGQHWGMKKRSRHWRWTALGRGETEQTGGGQRWGTEGHGETERTLTVDSDRLPSRPTSLAHLKRRESEKTGRGASGDDSTRGYVLREKGEPDPTPAMAEKRTASNFYQLKSGRVPEEHG